MANRVIDGLRLAFGTFSVLPVTPPRVVGRREAAFAMLAAPWIGALLGGIAAAVGWLVAARAPGLFAAVAVVATLAVLTRGLHLDGLADTADGLGSGRRGGDALAIMRRSDIGPFGVVTIVLVLLADVAALAALDRGDLWVVVPVAAASGRAGVTMACTRGIRAADSHGLGATVAGTVPLIGTATTIVVLGAIAALTLEVAGVAIVLAALAVSGAVLVRCITRFGGVSGDVLGAIVELGTLAGLVTAAMTL
jgi:adenosylcobinamide-GDP ribazoletransferase